MDEKEKLVGYIKSIQTPNHKFHALKQKSPILVQFHDRFEVTIIRFELKQRQENLLTT